MNMHTAVRLHLLNYPGVQPIVGNRIYWLRKPESVEETCISFSRVSNPKDSKINRYSPRFQFDVWSTSGEEASELAELVDKAFDRFKGVMGGEAGKPIKQGSYENMTELYEEDTGIYHIPVDVFFYYLEN